MKLNGNSGFTLIELIIIIVILGILAAVAIPTYQDITGEAKEASCRGALGGLRSGITIFYANAAATTGTATWPTLAEVNTIGTVMLSEIPRNPYVTDANFSDSIVVGVAKGTVVGTDCGWAYLDGQIWPNTTDEGSNDW